MEKMRQEEFWQKVSQISGGLEPILRYFLEANGFRNFGSFLILNTKFDDEIAERMTSYVRGMKESNKYFKVLSDWYEEPLSEFVLLEGWKSSLRTVFLAMNACDPTIFMGQSAFYGEQKKVVEAPKRCTDNHVPQPQINPLIIQQMSKRYKHDESDPNFIQSLIEKFQTKIFTKLKESDVNLKGKDKSEINVSYVGEMENGKKFEAKCVYCPTSCVIYWRYTLTSANADTFYPKINDCNYFKHVVKIHPESGLQIKSRSCRQDQAEIIPYNPSISNHSNQPETFPNHIKIEQHEW